MATFIKATAAVLLCASIWRVLSKLSCGYEFAGQHVCYRSFNNLTWKIERREVPEASAIGFVTLPGSGGRYGSDLANVFFENTRIAGADCSTFKVLDWRKELSQDHQAVYWKSILISRDPSNFQILDRGYSRDSQAVYYAGHIVEGADPETFVVIGTATSVAIDKHHEFDMGRQKQKTQTKSAGKQ